MRLEKIKRKIADGYNDEEIANMSGMPVASIAEVRNPPVIRKAPAPVRATTPASK